MSEKIRVVLPEKYDLVVGDTFQLFYLGIIEAPNPFCYDILCECEKGRNCPRYFEFTPDSEGEYKLRVSVFDASKNLLGSAETILKVATPEAPKKPLNILCIGSSTTSGGEWINECFRRFTGHGGTPEGLGFPEINFIGTQKRGDISCEGYGGWRWDSFYRTVVGGMWVVSNGNDKTTEDQHSIWQDDNGNLWQLETLGGSWLKFNRYLQHKGERPTSGKLIPYNNAVNLTPINIDRSSDEAKSPFLDEESGEIDFKKYCDKNGFDGIDACYIMLGGNGLQEAYIDGVYKIEEHCKNNVERAKILIGLIKKSYPDAKITVLGLIPPSAIGGMGASYGAVMPYCDYYGYLRYILETNRALEGLTKEPEYKDFMDFVNISGQFDAVNNTPSVEKQVNIRNSKTELVGINGLHPLPEGYMQVADAVFRNLVHLVKRINDEM